MGDCTGGRNRFPCLRGPVSELAQLTHALLAGTRASAGGEIAVALTAGNPAAGGFDAEPVSLTTLTLTATSLQVPN